MELSHSNDPFGLVGGIFSVGMIVYMIIEAFRGNLSSRPER